MWFCYEVLENFIIHSMHKRHSQETCYKKAHAYQIKLDEIRDSATAHTTDKSIRKMAVFWVVVL
jgi:hypothetical protein